MSFPNIWTLPDVHIYHSASILMMWDEHIPSLLCFHFYTDFHLLCSSLWYSLSSACEIWSSHSVEYYVLSLLWRGGLTASIIRANDYSSVWSNRFLQNLPNYLHHIPEGIDQKLSVKFQKIQMIHKDDWKSEWVHVIATVILFCSQA
jgi:hypothetical protein